MKKLIALLFLLSFSFPYIQKQKRIFEEIKNLDNPKNIKYVIVPLFFNTFYYFRYRNDVKDALSYHCIDIIVLKNGNRIYNLAGYVGLCPNEYILDNNATLTTGDFSEEQNEY